jgi:hypothetical protein
MTKKLCSLAAIAAVGAFVAGCGSSSNNTSSSVSSALSSAASSVSSAASSVASSASSAASTAASSPSSVAVPQNLAQAVALCKSSIGAAATLSADLKTKLQSLCDQAGQPGANVKQIQYQVCTEIIKSTLPSAAQQAALATCPKP